MDVKEQLVVSLFRFRKIGMVFPDGLSSQLKALDVSMTELVLMKAIADNELSSEENISIADIQNHLFVTKAAVSQMYAALEKKGYLNRETDKNNRRKLIVTLTSKGQEILSVMEDKMVQFLSELVHKVGEDNTEQLINLINRFAEALDELKDDVFQ